MTASPVAGWPRIFDTGYPNETHLCYHPNAWTEEVVLHKPRYAGNERVGFKLVQSATVLTRLTCPDCQSLGYQYGDTPFDMPPGIIVGAYHD